MLFISTLKYCIGISCINKALYDKQNSEDIMNKRNGEIWINDKEFNECYLVVKNSVGWCAHEIASGCGTWSGIKESKEACVDGLRFTGLVIDIDKSKPELIALR